MEGRGRTCISLEQKAVLVSLFDAGMSSTTNVELIKEAAQRTGLDIGVIRTWIGNHKRGPGPPRAPKHKLLYTKGSSGYNRFVGEELSTGTSNTFSEAASKWSSLDDATKSGYRQRAAAVKAAEPPTPLGPHDRLRIAKRHLNQLDIEVKSLQTVGIEALALVLDPKDPTWLVEHSLTNAGQSFCQATGVMDDFAVHCKALHSSGGTSTSSSKPQKADLCKKVTALFSQKYKDAGGEGLLPYMKATKGYLKVNGLPDGLNLRKSNLYGVGQLTRILNSADQISFEIVNQCAEEGVMAVPTPVEMESGEVLLEQTDTVEEVTTPMDADEMDSNEDLLLESDTVEEVEEVTTLMDDPPLELEGLGEEERINQIESYIYEPATTKSIQKQKHCGPTKKPKPAPSVLTAVKGPVASEEQQVKGNLLKNLTRFIKEKGKQI